MRRLALALLFLVGASAPVAAHRTSFGFHFLFWPAPFYYYAPPPVYYYPAPPVYYHPAPTRHYVQRSYPRPYCREFRGDAIIDDTGNPFFGTACLEPDGRWHIVY
ncbi:MAG: hypothetical protein ACREGL_03015 [Alphaproteobacteria bacterium]